jgi:hypothetical protein
MYMDAWHVHVRALAPQGFALRTTCKTLLLAAQHMPPQPPCHRCAPCRYGEPRRSALRALDAELSCSPEAAAHLAADEAAMLPQPQQWGRQEVVASDQGHPTVVSPGTTPRLAALCAPHAAPLLSAAAAHDLAAALAGALTALRPDTGRAPGEPAFSPLALTWAGPALEPLGVASDQPCLAETLLQDDDLIWLVSQLVGNTRWRLSNCYGAAWLPTMSAAAVALARLARLGEPRPPPEFGGHCLLAPLLAALCMHESEPGAAARMAEAGHPAPCSVQVHAAVAVASAHF